MRYIKKLFKVLFIDKTDNTAIQFFRSLFVGGIATVVDMGILAILTKVLGVDDYISATIGFIFGLIVNYIISIKFVFKSRNIKNQWIEFIIFSIIGIIGLGLTLLIIKIFKLYNIDVLISKIVSVVAVYFWNFFARKILLYRG